MDEREIEFAQWLDEWHEPAEVLGVTVAASTVLWECDRIAFREAFLNWEDFNDEV